MIYFFIYLFLEVMISTAISSAIGGLNTFFEILISAIIGILILKNFKVSFVENIKKARTGQITQEEFIKANAGKALGAVLLIIPGFFTDIVGVLLQFAFLVGILGKVFSFKNPNHRTTYSTNFGSTAFEYDEKTYKNTNNSNYKRKTDEIIDVEIIDDTKPLKH